MGIEDNKKVFLTFIEEVLHNKKTDMIYDLITANHISHNSGGNEMHGVDNYKNAIETVSKAFPDMHYEVEMMIAEGDLVCTCLRSSATHKGEFMGMAPTGNKYTWKEVAISRYEDGKIAEEWGYVVRPGLLDQVKENADRK